LCCPRTFEIGCKINEKNEFLYFLSKGTMKWQNSDQIAKGGHFIGNLRRFYQKKYLKDKQKAEDDEGNYIETVETTSAL
jgi:hypothetical protein